MKNLTFKEKIVKIEEERSIWWWDRFNSKLYNKIKEAKNGLQLNRESKKIGERLFFSN